MEATKIIGIPLTAAPYDLHRLLKQAVNPSAEQRQPRDLFTVQYESLTNHVPRALNARHTTQAQWRATDGCPAQGGGGSASALDPGTRRRKSWTAAGCCGRAPGSGRPRRGGLARIITKSGIPVPAPSFTRFLPPFPLVGELYLGNHTLQQCTELLRRPENNRLWAHARPGAAP
jgi:hypothetical protein